MSNEIRILVRRPDLVLETSRAGEAPSLEGFEDGWKVHERGFLLDRILLTGYFILPRLGKEAGRLPLLSVARGLVPEPGKPPVVWLAERVAGPCPAVFFDFHYDASASRFFAGTNVGSASGELAYAATGDAAPDVFAGRVLRVFAVLDRGGPHVLVEDPFSDEVAVYGDGAAVRRESARPFEGPPGGNWFVRFGKTDANDETLSVLPAGFGLSDLQITFLGPCAKGCRFLRYGGALDHLVAPGSPRPPATANRVLRIIAGTLRSTAEDLETIADCLRVIRGAGDVVIGKRSYKELWF